MESSDYTGLFVAGFIASLGGGMILRGQFYDKSRSTTLKDTWFAWTAGIFFTVFGLLSFFLAFYWEIFESSVFCSAAAGIIVSPIVSSVGYITKTYASRSGKKIL
jgi:hypothetical protein